MCGARLVTVPPPLPPLKTVRVEGWAITVKVTETELASVIVNSQTPVPSVQWPRAEPVPESAVRCQPDSGLAVTLIAWP